MKKDLNSYLLTREELRIMKIIWKRGNATVREVCDAISRKKKTAYTTTLTLMQILERKGALVRKRIGRSYLYTPVISRKQATQNQVNDLMVRFFDGSPHKLIETVEKYDFDTSQSTKNVLNHAELKYEITEASSSGSMR